MLNSIGNYRKSVLGICIQLCYIVYMFNTTTKGNKMKTLTQTQIVKIASDLEAEFNAQSRDDSPYDAEGLGNLVYNSQNAIENELGSEINSEDLEGIFEQLVEY